MKNSSDSNSNANKLERVPKKHGCECPWTRPQILGFVGVSAMLISFFVIPFRAFPLEWPQIALYSTMPQYCMMHILAKVMYPMLSLTGIVLWLLLSFIDPAVKNNVTSNQLNIETVLFSIFFYVCTQNTIK